MDLSYLKQSIEMAVENVRQDGGPFAALVVKNGAIIARGVNQVTRTNDPTAHAEIVAIREACRVLGAFELAGCDFYTSCEPCPMCLGALYWARPDRVYYAATQTDAAAAGFDDAFIYQQIAQAPAERAIPMIHASGERSLQPFEEWMAKANKKPY